MLVTHGLLSNEILLSYNVSFWGGLKSSITLTLDLLTFVAASKFVHKLSLLCYSLIIKKLRPILHLILNLNDCFINTLTGR